MDPSWRNRKALIQTVDSKIRISTGSLGKRVRLYQSNLPLDGPVKVADEGPHHIHETRKAVSFPLRASSACVRNTFEDAISSVDLRRSLDLSSGIAT